MYIHPRVEVRGYIQIPGLDLDRIGSNRVIGLFSERKKRKKLMNYWLGSSFGGLNDLKRA